MPSSSTTTTTDNSSSGSPKSPKKIKPKPTKAKPKRSKSLDVATIKKGLGSTATTTTTTPNTSDHSKKSTSSHSKKITPDDYSDNYGVRPILKLKSCTGQVLTHSKRIHFHNKKKTKRIPNIASYPPEILGDIWWASEDYETIMRSFDYIVFMMEAGSGKVMDEGDEHCTRGLELRTEAGKWARFEHKRDCYNAVLDEQDRQWNNGEDNQSMIANAVREVSAKTQRIACRKGMQDERAIAEFVADTRAIIKKNNFDEKYLKHVRAAKPKIKKGLPARSKSNSTGALPSRKPERTESGKARVERSPPRKPERVLSGKSERSVTPMNSSSAPRTPKRSVSGKSSGTGTALNKTAMPRVPSRQTFSNGSNSNLPEPIKRLPARTSSKSSRSDKSKIGSGNTSKSNLLTNNKIPKRSASQSSSASADSQ